jgi:hypothetical protein
MTKPHMEHEKKTNEFDQRQESAKKKMKVGRKLRAAMRNLFLLKRKLFRKLTAVMIILKKTNRLAVTMIKKKKAHGNKNEHIEGVMNQNRVELRSLIIKPLSNEERNIIDQIIKNKEAKPGEIYIYYENEEVSWGSMQRLLNRDTKAQSKRWINNQVINFYFK